MKDLSKIILRVGISLVFLWFGLNQLFDTNSWTGYVPEFALNFGLNAYNIVFLNGILELLLGLFLIIGFYTRISALILGIHLFGISLGLGYGALMIRDLGLAIATLSIAFSGADEFCLDKKDS